MRSAVAVRKGERLQVISLAALCVGILIGPAAHAWDVQQPGNLRVSVTASSVEAWPRLRLHVAVTDEAGVVKAGLRREHFRVAIDDVPVPLVEMATVSQDAPLAVVLAVDRSGSMRGGRLERAKGAAGDFVSRLASNQSVGVLAFDTNSALLVAPTRQRDVALGAIGRITIGSDTALRDAVVASLTALTEVSVERRSMVLLSDGRDTASRASVDEVLALVKQAAIPIHVVAMGSEVDGEFLQTLARASGGTAMTTPDEAGLLSAFRTVMGRIQSEYVLTVNPPATIGQELGLVRVVVSEPGFEGFATRRVAFAGVAPIRVPEVVSWAVVAVAALASGVGALAVVTRWRPIASAPFLLRTVLVALASASGALIAALARQVG